MTEPETTAPVHSGAASGLASAVVTFALFASSLGLAAVEDEGVAVGVAASPSPVVGVGELDVAAELDGDDYDRDEFKHWVDADGDRCDTRQEVLLLEARTEPVLDPEKCQVISGEWFSVYDSVVVTEPSKLDIDHMVPLKEAWESAAKTWTPEQRQAYANDLDTPLALLAVTASTNRSKSDRDPAEWKPPDPAWWCAYATAWIGVKVEWSLSADEDEVAALEEMLAGC
jgi:hypothetical protein